ncbi:3216_t:CDS:2 [Gigaspora rosea]|nr:3216_t:CDS:2 [Gigaspora rosea]
MPTLTSQEPDTLDLDFFYKNVSRTYGTYRVAIYEDNSLIVKPIQKNFHPTTCFDTNFRSIKNANTTQQTIPLSPSSQHKSALTNPTNPSSSSLSLHIHTCPKYWYVISCKMANNQYYPQDDVIKEGEDYYHSSCIANIFALTSTMASNQAFLQQQLEQTYNTSTFISNTSTTKTSFNISLTNTTSLPKQQQNSNLFQSNKNTQHNQLANLFLLTPLKTSSTKNINTSSMEIDLSTNFQDSPATNQLFNKDTNQT